MMVVLMYLYAKYNRTGKSNSVNHKVETEDNHSRQINF